MYEKDVFLIALDWLKHTYSNYIFFTERDIVWTLQTKIQKIIRNYKLPYLIVNDYGILPTKGRSISVDLAILKKSNEECINDPIEVAIEFKYEPSHERKGIDIPACKFPVVSWNSKDGSVLKDIRRIRSYINQGKAKHAYAIFIDEGNRFKMEDAPEGSEWIPWGDKISILFTSKS